MKQEPISTRVTQTQQIKEHLLRKGSITNVEAQALFKSRSITKRIHELREQGFDIYSEWNTDTTGQRYVRYWLRKKEPARPTKEDTPVTPAGDPPKKFLVDAAEHWVETGDKYSLIAAFYWNETPQGYDFWDSVYHGTADAETVREATEIVQAWLKKFAEKAGPVPVSFSRDSAKKWVQNGRREDITSAFYWGDSQQGFHYWDNVVYGDATQEHRDEAIEIVRHWLHLCD